MYMEGYFSGAIFCVAFRDIFLDLLLVFWFPLLLYDCSCFSCSFWRLFCFLAFLCFSLLPCDFFCPCLALPGFSPTFLYFTVSCPFVEYWFPVFIAFGGRRPIFLLFLVGIIFVFFFAYFLVLLLAAASHFWCLSVAARAWGGGLSRRLFGVCRDGRRGRARLRGGGISRPGSGVAKTACF